jgi:hypothetical protein
LRIKIRKIEESEKNKEQEDQKNFQHKHRVHSLCLRRTVFVFYLQDNVLENWSFFLIALEA